MNTREHIESIHAERYGVIPAYTAFAPGRIEVLGNHTDYNQGLVLSAAIPEGVTFTLSSAENNNVCIYACDLHEDVRLNIGETRIECEYPWVDYCLGVLRELKKTKRLTRGFNAAFGGTLPMGAGLSSSAAMELAMAQALTAYYHIDLAPIDLADLCRRAESGAAGVQCGLLDQITSLFGKHQHLILIDFKTLKIDPIPFPENMQFLICDPGVKHTLADSEYNSRRTECEESVQLFRRMLQRDIRSLRDISLHELADYGKHMEEIPVRRAVHVISENMRVEQAVKMLRRNEMELLGSMMFASHESSIQNFENSSPEQDMVVLAAKRLDQVLGARLTGGGFGGNVLVLVKRENAEYVGQALTRKYEELQGHPLHVRLAYPADGSRILA